MQHKLDQDWKSKMARDYFAMTWDGPSGNGIIDGNDNLDRLYKIIDDTFHPNYQFTRPNGDIINEGTDELKKILYKLTTPLKNLKMTSFDIISIDNNSVTFQSTAVANKKEDGERYTQYLRLTYVFKDKKVCRTIVYYHTNYEA